MPKLSFVFIGDEQSGKSSLIARYFGEPMKKTYQKTFGLVHLSRQIASKEMVSFVDASGWLANNYPLARSNLIYKYAHKATVIFLVFDLSNEESYLGLTRWIAFIKAHLSDKKVILLGAKSDKPHAVDETIVIRFAKSHGFYAYCSTSTTQAADISSLMSMMYSHFGTSVKSEADYEKIWQEGTSMMDNIRSLLDDYALEDKLWRRVLALKAKRRHTAEVAKVINDIDSQKLSKPKDVLKCLKQLITNPFGSLARRIHFIEKKLSQERTETRSIRLMS